CRFAVDNLAELFRLAFASPSDRRRRCKARANIADKHCASRFDSDTFSRITLAVLAKHDLPAKTIDAKSVTQGQRVDGCSTPTNCVTMSEVREAGSLGALSPSRL